MDDLERRLMETSASGQPWPAQVERTLARTRPVQLLRMFRQMGVRNEVVAPEGLPLLTEMADRSRPGRNDGTKSVISLPRLVYLLRAQWDYTTSEFSQATRSKLDHVWQIQACPVAIRKRMARVVGFTFLPGRRLEAFPEGEEFLPLRFLNVLSLGFRPQRNWADNQVIDMLDVKVHSMSVNSDTSRAELAPRYARYFSFTPFTAADRRIVEADNVSVIRSGLDLHRAMEWGAVTGSSIRDEPEFPRIYLGFAREDDVDMEVTTDLKIAAWRYLEAYIKAGKPGHWSVCQGLACVGDKLDGRVRPTWADYVRLLGLVDAEFVLASVLEAETVQFDGLVLRPLEFFQRNSEQFPVRRCVRAYARMHPGLMRRDVLRGIPRFDDRGVFAGVDGVVEPTEGLAKLQVIRAPDRSYWAGVTGPIDWDFRSVPEFSRDYFQESSAVSSDWAPDGAGQSGAE